MPLFQLDLGWFTLAPTWYGLMYALGFLFFLWGIGRMPLSERHRDTLFLYTVLGVIIGGRLGYVLLYNLGYYLEHLDEIVMIWRGGMSFHGGALGVIVAWYLVARKVGVSYLWLADECVWMVPIGLFFGRIGNYINGELLGFAGYDGVFARVVDGVSYFPSPLLEALLEGLLLGGVLWFVRQKKQYMGQIGVWFLGGYGVCRFLVEFVRMPDAHIGYIIGWLTLGQILSLAMIVSACVLSVFFRRLQNR